LKRLDGATGGEGSRRLRGGSGDGRLPAMAFLSAAGPVGTGVDATRGLLVCLLR
jgi:hypothetical protein